MTVYGVGLSLL